MKLEEKQERFEYRSPADLYVHPEPFSPDGWNRTLAKIGGHCPYGDPRLRIVWGGTAKKKGYIQTPERSEEALVIKYPAPVPRVRVLKGYYYLTRDGKRAFVGRADRIPPGRLSQPVFEYSQLGALRWILERKFTPEELVAMQMYPDPRSHAAKTYGVRRGRRYVAPMDPRGEYIGLYPLQTPDGKYFEPTEEWFELLRKTEKESREATEGDKSMLINAMMDALDRQERRAAEYEAEQRDIIWEESVVESEKEPKGRVFFLPK